MSADASPTAMPSRRRAPAWVREAIVKTLAGLMLGLVTAAAIVWVSNSAFPGLQAFGEDLGLRLGAAVDRMRAGVWGRPRTPQQDVSFVFLDVDPQPTPGASEDACAALARAARGAGPSGRLPSAASSCSSARPVNRYLLAALIEELRKRGARLVVMDIVLAHEPGVISADENEVLHQVLLANRPTMPVVFAAPYEATSPSPAGWRVSTALPALIADDVRRGVQAAAAVPAPGQPVRRYPKCLLPTSDGDARIASLPYLAARLLSADSAPCAPGRDVGENAPRIVYTLPSMPGHQDDVQDPARARWATYRTVYNRCLASNFWDASGSFCAKAEAYAGKVVVIGVSNPLRRDRHYTPLGDMAGPEVVINAVRSFIDYPEYRDKSLAELLSKKAQIVGWCSLTWLGYFLVRCRLSRPNVGVRKRVVRAVAVSVAFLTALASAIGVALWTSFEMDRPVPSLDVLVPVLAIAVDEYVEQVSKLVRNVEGMLGSWLGLHESRGKGH
jgi:CHASE2 domain-containing sensor protein